MLTKKFKPPFTKTGVGTKVKVNMKVKVNNVNNKRGRGGYEWHF